MNSEAKKPREKLLELKNPSQINTEDLIAIILGHGSKGKNVFDLSKELVEYIRINLNNSITIEELSKFPGIGTSKALQIISALELGRRFKWTQENIRVHKIGQGEIIQGDCLDVMKIIPDSIRRLKDYFQTFDPFLACNLKPNMKQIIQILTSLILIFFTLFGVNAYGQRDITKGKDNPRIEELRKDVEVEKEKIEKLTEVIQDLKTQNAVLTKSLDILTIFFGIFGGLISIVLIIGTITSLISWNKDRKRSDEIHSLALEKERESSERDRSIFSQSTETLNLVNQTLELAKDASERASKSLEEKLNKQHGALEQESIDLIEESKAYKNFKILVEDLSFRSNLLTLASEIRGLQNNQNILEKEAILHPYCCFIRGMEFHLNQHFKPAIKYWKQAKDHKDSPKHLQIMALYWIGYEQNNLSEFENASSNFELASSIATGAMKFELERIKIESKFFDFPKFTPEKLLPEIESLYRSIKNETDSEEIQKFKSNIAGTLGNIYYQLGNELSVENNNLSTKYYEKAKSTFWEAPAKDKWIWFGYGESCYKLGEYKEAEKYLLNKVKKEAEFEYSTRLEPRTKVLGQSTVLICSTIVKSLHKNVNTIYNLIKTTLGGVDERLTVYSQFQRRNVSKKRFLDDLDIIMEKFHAVSASKTS
ncbi:MAG: hypothetical protein QME07_02740 [bacterium]|nr:hypothetical protein [bacterium]